LAKGNELRHDAIDGVDRDGKTDAGVGAGGAVNGGVDPDEPAGAVEERPAAVARIDGRVGLDDALDGPLGDALDLAPQAADDAGGESLIQAKGIADGVDLLTDEKVTGGTDGE